MGFFWMDSVWGGGFHPPCYLNQFCSDRAEIFTGYVKPCESNKSGQIKLKNKKFRENFAKIRQYCVILGDFLNKL